MKDHNGLWIASFLIAVLLQTLTIINAKDVKEKKHITPLHRGNFNPLSNGEESHKNCIRFLCKLLFGMLTNMTKSHVKYFCYK